MRTLNNAISASKMSLNEAKAERIQREHAQIIDLVKTNLGITDFKNESEKTRNEVRSLILEMWTPENGLTQKGVRAISEGVVSAVTPESSEENVRKFCNKSLLVGCRKFVAGTYSQADLKKELEDLRKQVSADTKRAYGREFVDSCFAECMCKAVSAAFGVKMCKC